MMPSDICYDESGRLIRPSRFLVIVRCPHCGASMAWNQHSTARKCRNIDCGELVRLRDVSQAIDDELQNMKGRDDA